MWESFRGHLRGSLFSREGSKNQVSVKGLRDCQAEVLTLGRGAREVDAACYI